MQQNKLTLAIALWLAVWPAATAYSAIGKRQSEIKPAEPSAGIWIGEAKEGSAPIHCYIDPKTCQEPKQLAIIEVGESNADKVAREAEEQRIKEEHERQERERIEREQQEAEQRRIAEAKAKADADRLAKERAASKAKADKARAVPERPLAVAAPPVSGSCYDIAYAMAEARWPGQGNAMKEIVRRESGCNPKALNKSSGACGIPQALPCSKIPGGINASIEVQLEWMINYIAGRYGTPAGAVQWHNGHNWY
jgi:hypothetical protein